MAGPSETLEVRTLGRRLKTWLLLEVDRRVLAAGILVGFFFSLVAVLELWPAALSSVLPTATPAKALFQALTTATITAVTLVITINQLVLSQELGAAGDQRQRMQEATEFRHDVNDHLDEPAAPADPASFLQGLVVASRDSALDLRAAFSEHPEDDLRSAVDVYVDDLVENAETVAEMLDGARFGSYDLVSAAIDYNYSWKLYRAEFLQSEHAAALDDAQREAFADLIDVLQLFAPAREHFKTLYFQWELTDLSRAVLYAALPALVVSIAATLFLDTPSVIPGSTLGVENLVWVVASAATTTMLPFALLMSYILRIATITKRTLAMGPFVLREDDRTGDRGPSSADD